MNSMPKDLDQGLLLELECPVCLERMIPPITMCENGHSICPKCKPKLNNCPSCSKPFLHVRNLALESLSRHVIPGEDQLPPVRLPNDIECPFTRISKDICPWKGPLTGIRDHINFMHKSLNDTFEASGVFTIILTGLSPTQYYRKAVFIEDELFYVHWQIKDGSLFCAVFYVGEQEKCSNYTYKFVLTTESDNRKISMAFPTRGIMENVEAVLHSGDCVLLNYNTVLKFLNQNMYLECEFEINAIEVAADISGGVDHQNLCAEPGVQIRKTSRRRHHKHDKPGRCAHGRRFKHCRICKYSAVLTNTPGSNAASGTPSPQNSQPQRVSYCAPGVNQTEVASANSNFPPSAQSNEDLYYAPKGNISTALSNNVGSYDGKLSSSGQSLLTAQTSYNLPAGNVMSNSNVASGTPSLQNSQPQHVSYYTPGVNLTEGASANYNFPPTAPSNQDLYYAPKGNISPALSNDVKSYDGNLSSSGRSSFTAQTPYNLPTGNVLSNSSSDSYWKCPICERMVPTVPASISQPGWHVSSSYPSSQRCKMCGHTI